MKVLSIHSLDLSTENKCVIVFENVPAENGHTEINSECYLYDSEACGQKRYQALHDSASEV